MDSLEQQIVQLKAKIKEYEQGIHADQLLHSIAINSPSNIMMLDLSGRVRYINHIVPGVTREEVIGQYLPDLVEEQHRAGIIAAIERCAATQELDRYETSYTSPIGDVSWWDCRLGPMIQESKMTGFVVISTNMTEQRRKHEEQERFFQVSVDLMCVAGYDGYFKRVSPSFPATLGYSEEELLSRPFLEFVHPDDRADTLEAFENLDETNAAQDFHNRYRASDGTYRRLSWRGVPDLNNALIYAIARDVTVTKSLEEQLQQSRRLEAVGHLAGGIAHDFNNLLSAIQGNIELALLTENKDSVFLRKGIEAVGRAAELTNQLLVFSQNQSLSPQVIDVVPLLESLISFLERLLPESIAVSLHCQEYSPRIFADKSQIEQVIVNLCVNARDSMPEGGKLDLTLEYSVVPQQALTTTPDNSAKYLMLKVTDTGHGMSEAVLARVFEPFFTTKEIGKGTGLGLATVYAIVNQHKGFIETESNLGVGTTFKIFMPTTEKPLKVEDVPSELTEFAMEGTETVLVAEDDLMVRHSSTSLLQHAGYKVLVAHDGVEALELFEHSAGQIDLALLDVVMPKLGGLDTAARLRATNPDLKIVFVSGHVQHPTDHKRLEAEVLLRKPYRRDALLSCIRRALDSDNKQD
ncbi:MAG: PAS domain S-box protein [Planctomycetota bacterium]|nr:PAS domain S-box protein [Planctomycetota bacterium]